MILIADSGTTKCDWVVLGENKKVVLKIRTRGINPRLLTTDQIRNIIDGDKELTRIKEDVNKVLFYGAGCAGEQPKINLQKAFSDFFFKAKITIEEDLTAAVHGTTSLPGVVCILGTGSNCCYFDGTNIHVHQASMGYSVMDEGSGNYFGKQLLRAYFYNRMPLDLKVKFEESFDLSQETVLKNLYEFENPSAYLANFATFLIQNSSDPFSHAIIKKGINELFDTLLMCYNQELRENPLHFVGSIAFYLQKEITEEALDRQIKLGSFVQRPINNIIKNVDSIIT